MCIIVLMVYHKFYHNWNNNDKNWCKILEFIFKWNVIITVKIKWNRERERERGTPGKIRKKERKMNGKQNGPSFWRRTYPEGLKLCLLLWFLVSGMLSSHTLAIFRLPAYFLFLIIIIGLFPWLLLNWALMSAILFPYLIFFVKLLVRGIGWFMLYVFLCRL